MFQLIERESLLSLVETPADIRDEATLILSGVSGAGKSTFANQARRRAPILSADDFFITPEGKYEFNPSLLPDAHAWCLRHYARAVLNARATCDNTNTSLVEIAPYLALALAEYRKVVVAVFMPHYPGERSKAAHHAVEACIARNKHGVPPHVVWAQRDRVEKMLEDWPPFWPTPYVVLADL